MVSVGSKVGVDDAALPDLLRYRTLRALGLSRHRLERLLAVGAYERIAPGLFLRAGVVDDTTAAWMAIATKRAEATICLLSALAVHDLTDEIPSRTDIAIPRGSQPLTVRYAPIAIQQMARRAGADVQELQPSTYSMRRTACSRASA